MSTLAYYALGGGHGHVVRGLALISRLGHGYLIGPARLAPWAEALDVEYRSPPAEERATVYRWLAELAPPDLVVVDTFPAGVASELHVFIERSPAWLVARRVPPRSYLDTTVRALIENRYERIVWVEPPHESLRDLRIRQDELPAVVLEAGHLSRTQARALLGVHDAKPLILGIGSGDIERQRRMQLLLLKIADRIGAGLRYISAELPQDKHVRRLFPASSCLQAADAVVAAGGYHIVHEIAACGAPAVFIPQKRRHDDQFDRVRGRHTAHDPSGLERALRGLLQRTAAARHPTWPGGARLLVREIESRLRTTSRV